MSDWIWFALLCVTCAVIYVGYRYMTRYDKTDKLWDTIMGIFKGDP